jgi:putative PIN family toxin of toxin-antitoxin system
VTPSVAVIDTNVVASGIITSNPESLQAKVLDGMLSGELRFLLSTALLEEYSEVLSRPKLSKYHRRSEHEIANLLQELKVNAIWFEPASSLLLAPDPEDQHLWDLVAGWKGSVLVTGDQKLLDASCSDVPVRLPKDFLDIRARDTHI